MNQDLLRIVGALGEYGVELADEEKAALEKAADGVANEAIEASAHAVMDGLNQHGLAGLAENGVKSAIGKAIPGIETSADAALNGFIDHLEALLKVKAAQLAAG